MEFGDPRLPARFWAKVNPNGPEVRSGLGPCWIWIGGRISTGYGAFAIKKTKIRLAHRVIWTAAQMREIAPRLVIMHACDNRSCVNPAHLSEGTDADNHRDMVSKNRSRRLEVNGKQASSLAVREAIRRSNATIAELSRRYSLSRTQIARIRKCQTAVY